MNKRKDGGKITLGMIKGKPINTSVPSIAIRFHANAEEIEELYQSEEESTDKPSNEKAKYPLTGVGDPESSPLRSYLPRLGKRSTSIDTSLTSQDSSPPSDRWKFFAEIKGKITKSVEDTITEIKHRNQESDSSSKKSRLAKDKDNSSLSDSRNQESDSSSKKSRLTKDKDNSSLSDSEDLSESSISKTCGIVSTTEGVEMSSDDETPSLEKDKKPPEASQQKSATNSDTNLKQKLKINRKKKPCKESKIGIKTLADLYEINTGLKATTSIDKSYTSEENVEEVESGVEALEDINLQLSNTALQTSRTEESDLTSTASDVKIAHRASTDEEIISSLVEHIDNLEVDDNKVLNLEQISGSDIRRAFLTDSKSHTFLAPEGFVDLRPRVIELSWFDIIYRYRYVAALTGVLLFYFCMTIPIYISGFIAGVLCTLAITGVYNKFYNLNTSATGLTDQLFNIPVYNSQTILEIPAVKEYQPVTKFEGWMNEYPDIYDPQTYHICQTQPVYIRLQGNLLRISHTRAKIPKRAMWNEAKHKLVFTQHRIYNLIGAKVSLLPEGLNKRRHWSKKYPICITLNKDQLDFEIYNTDEKLLSEEKMKSSNSNTSGKSRSSFLRKKKLPVQTQIFSKLTEEEEEFELESGSSRPSSPSPLDDNSLDISEDIKLNDEEVDELLKDVFEPEEEQPDDDIVSLEDWTTFTPEEDSPTETHVYLFGRTDREKEDWFRRLVIATHKGAYLATNENLSSELDYRQSVSDTLVTAAKSETEYLKYMAKFQKVLPFILLRRKFLPKPFQVHLAKKKQIDVTAEETDQAANVLWINALIGRVLFDCIRDDTFANRVKDRIQRKLSSIKLPYFIEQLSVSELSLGSSPPLIHKASKPVLDQRGLWVDLDITYDGVVVLTLQTKLNLMKLKQPPSTESTFEENPSAKWQNSDVDDTAESSTDDETPFIPPAGKVLDDMGNPVIGLGGTSNTSKKFIKMVDKIAESKFFQAATENRYIKKAMEGVSNTDLGLKVELKGLVGTLVLNMPPPPSDRVWIGFRPTPKLWLTAQPIVGERNISFLGQLTNWIEKKLSQEFQKVLVIPNMEDIMIPVMSPKLPE